MGRRDEEMGRIVKEYEDKIANLENQVRGNSFIDFGRVAQLEKENMMLTKAIEILGERSFYTKLMYN